MNAKKLCMSLVNSVREQHVIGILKKKKLWDNPEAWRNYGDNENNYGTIGGQQSKPESAIVEKIVNSVDAVLMAECLKRKIDSEGDEAPRSIKEALIAYFNIPEGKLFNITATERTKLAENISIVSSGLKTKPCYAIIDRGEGQTPNKMPDTLLSIGKSNKLRIPFVQGKFNQGGTGVLEFCGERNLQLVISKRHPEVAQYENDSLKDMWGFTIIRREDPEHGRRNSIYTYLAPAGKVLSFKADSLPLLPTAYPNPLGSALQWGTYLKLFEYQMTGLKTNLILDPNYKLSILLPSIALPVRLYERREGYSGHSLEATLAGLAVRLQEDRNKNIEEGFENPPSLTFTANGEKLIGSIYVFKKGKAGNYTKNEGVVFTVNGQTQGNISKSFFSREKVKMGYIADSLLVIIDCSEFSPRAIEQLFMTSRDRLRHGDLRTEIIKNLSTIIREHPALKALREKRRKEQIQDRLGDSKPLADVISKILKTSPTLSKLFVDGSRLSNPFKVEVGKKKKKYKGKSFPSIFALTHEYTYEHPKSCPKNQRFRVQYKTDVDNDYFCREKDPGNFSLQVFGDDVEEYSINPWEGLATLNVTLPHDCKMGDVLCFRSEVDDINLVEPFTHEFHVIVEPPTKKRKGTHKGERKPPTNENKGKDSEKETLLDLPEVYDVRREDWEKHSFDEYSALKVLERGEEGYDFFVNIDNIHLLTEKKNSTIEGKLLDARYKYGMTLIGIAILNDHKNRKSDNEEGPNIFEQIAIITRQLSSVLLPMINSLGDLDIEEGEAD